MNREELIERIKAVRDDGYLSATYLGNEHVGDLMGDILDALEQAHTPTDDEREALIAAIERGKERPGTGVPITVGVANAVLAAGFHRTVQGEPNIRVNMDAPIPYVGTTDDFMVNVRPQGEPTDAQVGRAMNAVDAYYKSQGHEVQFESLDYQAMRAALRAAATAQ